MPTEDFDVISLSDFEDGDNSDFGVPSYDDDEDLISEQDDLEPLFLSSEIETHKRNTSGSETLWDVITSSAVDTQEHVQCKSSDVRCPAPEELGGIAGKPCKRDNHCSVELRDWDGNCNLAPVDRQESSNYDFAGRLPEITFSDLRSASKSKNRWRADQEKYYGYRYIKPAQLNALHYQSSEPPCSLVPFSAPLKDSPTTIMTKRKFYREAQRAPRPPTYHRRKHIKNYSPWRERYIVRMKERKHACQRIDGELDEV